MWQPTGQRLRNPQIGAKQSASKQPRAASASSYFKTDGVDANPEKDEAVEQMLKNMEILKSLALQLNQSSMRNIS